MPWLCKYFYIEVEACIFIATIGKLTNITTNETVKLSFFCFIYDFFVPKAGKIVYRGEFMSQLQSFFDAISEHEIEKQEIILKTINSKIRQCVTGKQTLNDFDYSMLARHIHYYAMSILDTNRLNNQTKSAANAPQWKTVTDEIKEFISTIDYTGSGMFCSAITDDQVGQFATMASRKRGSPSPNLYTTMALFIVHLWEKGKLISDFFKLALPKNEHDLPILILKFINAESGEMTPPKREVQETSVRFLVEKTRVASLDDFYNHFAFSSDDCSHMVIYRPMRSNPKALMKSFLSISPPKRHEGKESFIYSHYYHPPQTRKNNRFSSGKILPMKDGLYFVGGQNILKSGGAARTPFTSLKVIALRWQDINNESELIPGLVMSANYDGKPLVSRIAVRMTPIGHSERLNLGSVNIADLADDLQDDFAREKKALTEDSSYECNLTHFNTNTDMDRVVDLAREIALLTNNNPNREFGWAVPSGFTRKKGKKQEILNDNKFRIMTDDALGIDVGSQYTDKSNEPFGIWSSLRFGPLTYN